MVFFSCDGCGDMLKKSQVDVHAYRCRRCQSVSCVDCNVSFYGDDYRAHTSCLTEVERYEKKPGTSSAKNRKRTPQQQWMDLIQESISTAPQHLQPHLQTMASLDNVPRKEKAFRNFASNSLRNHTVKTGGGETTVSEIWNHLKGLREKQQQAKAQHEQQQKKKASSNESSEQKVESAINDDNEDDEGDTNRTTNSNEARARTNGTTDTSCIGPVSSDRPDDDKKNQNAGPAASSSEKPTVTKKFVKKAMKKVLKKATDHKLTLRQLRKSIVREYFRETHTRIRKRLLKNLVAQNLQKDVFIVAGKTVTLKVD